MNIDLEKLTEDQLDTLALVTPEAAAAVTDLRHKRRLYPHISEGYQALAEAGFKLEQLLAPLKKTEAVAAVKETGILNVISRLLLTAGENGFTVDTSKFLVVTTDGA